MAPRPDQPIARFCIGFALAAIMLAFLSLCVSFCMYSLNSFSADSLLRVIKTNRLDTIGNERENEQLGVQLDEWGRAKEETDTKTRTGKTPTARSLTFTHTHISWAKVAGGLDGGVHGPRIGWYTMKSFMLSEGLLVAEHLGTVVTAISDGMPFHVELHSFIRGKDRRGLGRAEGTAEQGASGRPDTGLVGWKRRGFRTMINLRVFNEGLHTAEHLGRTVAAAKHVRFHVRMFEAASEVSATALDSQPSQQTGLTDAVRMTSADVSRTFEKRLKTISLQNLYGEFVLAHKKRAVARK